MSDLILPDLPGLTWNTTKTPEFSTKVHTTASGKETRLAYWSYPRWNFGLSYEVLDGSAEVQDLQALGGFFLARQGAFDDFLVRDSSDYQVAGQLIGTGDGSRTAFQLVRDFGAFVEPMKEIDTRDYAPRIYLDGSLASSSAYSITAGLVTFTTAPGVGVEVTADFEFLFRVRFKEDLAEFNQFMADLWELKKMDLIGIKL